MTLLIFTLNFLCFQNPCDEGVIKQLPRFYSENCENIEDDDEFKRCSDKEYLTAIYSELKMPKEAEENKIEGTVYVEFKIDTEGYTFDFKVLRSIGHGCDEEAIRVLSGMTFYSAINDCDELVVHKMVSPIKFKLN